MIIAEEAHLEASCKCNSWRVVNVILGELSM